MALWKSGLFWDVLPMRVNCETQRISPSISLTLDFHIFPESFGSSNTRKERLYVVRYW